MDPYLFALIITIAPAVAVSIIGLGFAVERNAQHLRVSVFASLGLLSVIGSKVGSVILQLWIRDTAQSGGSITAMAMRISFINYALNGLSAIGLALITTAIFIDRKRQQIDA
jgi:hypothetical protein